MNDSDLITVLREQRGKVPMDTPVEKIIRRGRAVRARRRVPRVAAALGAAAAAAFAVSAALPASHPASEPGAQLAAWTVARQADGSIKVTIRELQDPAGLQQRLRADGVPASVTFSGQQNPACQGYPGGGSQSQRRHLLNSVITAPATGRDVMVIHPAALPSGAGLQINALFSHPGQHRSFEGFSVGLVQASPQCTGS
jgi:hypothetical protein